MPHPDALRWDERYAREPDRFALRDPRGLLTERLDLLPRGALILDAACGAAASGRYLAARGWRVIALDVSWAALRLARLNVKEEASPISFAVMDLTDPWLPPACFDVILNFYFLSRPIIPTYRETLKPGGLLFFETYLGSPGANPNRFLESQELRRLFDDWEIVHYAETERWAHARSGYKEKRRAAQLIARKPS